MQTQYSLGIDVGSTTVKTVVIDDAKQIIRSRYQRHYSRIKETVSEQLEQIAGEYPDSLFTLCITGSAGWGLPIMQTCPLCRRCMRHSSP